MDASRARIDGFACRFGFGARGVFFARDGRRRVDAAVHVSEGDGIFMSGMWDDAGEYGVFEWEDWGGVLL